MPKLPTLTAITTLADADEKYVVDKSDTTDHSSGSSRRITQLDDRTQILGLVIDQPLLANVAVDATTITDAPLASVAKVGQWIVLEANTVLAEFRRIDSISGAVITVARGFARAHAVGVNVLLVPDGQRNIIYWGADPTSSNITANVQAAIDDFDYRLDTTVEGTSGTFTATGDTITAVTPAAHLLHNTTQLFLTTDGTLPSPLAINTMYHVRDRAAGTFKIAKSPNGTAISGITGGSGTHTWHEARTMQANNLWFPQGTWTLGASIVLPTQSTQLGPGTTISGSNALIRTTSFTGPLFKGAGVRDFVANGVPGGNSWYTFEDLAFRDEIDISTTGTATVFDHTLYRMRLHRCMFSNFGWVIESDDTTDDDEDYIQSTRISECGFSNCDFIVEVSKAWDFYFCNNQTEFCNKAIHCVGTGSPGMVVGRICDNIFEGTGIGGHSIMITGPRALTLSGNYLEATGDTTNPEFDLTGGVQPRGITIIGNRFEPVVAQNEDRDWYPIAISNSASAVTITGNLVEGTLIDYNVQPIGDGENWNISDNYVLGEVPNSQTNLIGNGCRTVRRIGSISTIDETVTDMDFGGGAPLFPIGYANRGSAYSIRAHVIGMKNSAGSRESAAYDLFALFEDDDPGAALSQNGSTTKVEIETTVGWNADFIVFNGANLDFTTDFSTDTITSNSHGLSDGDAIYVISSGFDLPVPLVANKIYFVRDSMTNTFKLTWAPGQTAINLTDDGTPTHEWRQRDIVLQVRGAAATNIKWYADVTLVIGANF